MANISGDAGNNVLGGTNGGDTIYGAGGNDRLNGFGAADWLYGGPGATTIKVLGNDTFEGDDKVVSLDTNNGPANGTVSDRSAEAAASGSREPARAEESAPSAGPRRKTRPTRTRPSKSPLG